MSQDWRWGNEISGSKIKVFAKNRLQSYSEHLQSTKIYIALFAEPESASQLKKAAYQAAVTSANEKLKAFTALGCEVEVETLPQEIIKEKFGVIIDRLNSDSRVSKIIIQYPIPNKLSEEIEKIIPEKDLDSLSKNAILPTREAPVPATSEGIVTIATAFSSSQGDAIVQMVAGFVEPDTIVAVVGANGFVGSGVVKLLEARGINVLPIDLTDADFNNGEKLLEVRNADIVVSATGVPNILDERHITPYHRLVVDSGFVPIEGEIKSDIEPSAKRVVQNCTPVPGGVGPVEMAILMQRLVQTTVDPNLEPLTLRDVGIEANFLSRAEVEEIQINWAAAVYPIAQKWVSEQAIDPVTNSRKFETDRHTFILNQAMQSLSITAKGLREGEELVQFDGNGNATSISQSFNVTDRTVIIER